MNQDENKPKTPPPLPAAGFANTLARNFTPTPPPPASVGKFLSEGYNVGTTNKKNADNSHVITTDFLIKTIENNIEFSQSEQNLSAILAGFSLGSVVALLFIKSSIYVTIMFACSILASWLFIFITLQKTFFLESLRTILKHFERIEDIEEKYELIRNIHIKSQIWDYLFFAGILNFILVLICASFLVNITFGILGTSLCILLTILLFRNMRSLKFENYYFNWKPYKMLN